MKEIETRSTSHKTAVADEIVLRTLDRIRLVFAPTLVNNENNPLACVRGEFVYQKKAPNERWISSADLKLSSLKAGEHYKLELRSEELLTLVRELGPLYRLVRREGVPRGKVRFVRVQSALASFFELGQEEVREFLDLNRDHASTALLTLIKWIANSPRRDEAISRLAATSASQLPDLGVILGLAAAKEALDYWKENRDNGDEEFWQQALAKRTFALNQLFTYPVVVIQQKAYVGGKRVTNKGGNVVDFLSKVESTDSTILIEIKTPQTDLLGSEYRSGAFPLSRDLAGAITQVLRYRQSLMSEFYALTASRPKRLVMGEPKCLVIAGHINQLTTPDKKESFELQRERLQGVTVITYDEMFHKLEKLVTLFATG